MYRAARLAMAKERACAEEGRGEAVPHQVVNEVEARQVDSELFEDGLCLAIRLRAHCLGVARRRARIQGSMPCRPQATLLAGRSRVALDKKGVQRIDNPVHQTRYRLGGRGFHS